MGGRDRQGVWDGHVHTALSEMDNQQGLTVQKGVWERLDTCIYTAEAL